MPSPNNFLPVYGPDNSLLYHAPIASVPRLIESGRVRPLGTKSRVRALVALCGDIAHLTVSSSIPTGQRFSHNHETPDNPRGVWAFRYVTQ